ncbi:ribosome biogenesis protein bop1-A-like [Oppia nitens]|uniref:ribosome biogenesis protein bop1-A-like n=1 Tax=Oppia nitens TaxID=1686743 RepID=UPI0023DC40B7|nr:ribosome biogenesis protein bop1-A-like [Oppia nitens]XP_054164413.1 ribosome biogenesis protein bop1-A-like [Oppia nitens]
MTRKSKKSFTKNSGNDGKRKANVSFDINDGSDDSDDLYDEESDEEVEESDDEEVSDDNSVDTSSDADDEEDTIKLNDTISLQELSEDEDNSLDSDNELELIETKDENKNHRNLLSDSNEIEKVENILKAKKKSKNVAKVDEYAIDSSDEEDLRNTIGNIPYEWYNDFEHIGYNLDGNKIIKPPKVDEMQEFLNKMEDPLYWRTVKDRMTGQNVVLTDNDAETLRRVRKGKFPDPNYNPYEPFIDFFTYEKSIHPVSNRPETKASFIPSLSEKRKISKLVAAIKAGRLKPKPIKPKDGPFVFSYDLWEKPNTERNKRYERYIPAPKLQPPRHEESYNPPPEYLFNEEEEQKWLEQEPEERKLNFIPQKYSSLRRVPAYSKFVNERFERLLDLYLCPRARKDRANVNPEDLIPKLPRPRDLQPFPSIQSLIYRGHTDVVRCVSIEPNGQFIATGSDDCTIRIWEVLTTRTMKIIKMKSSVTDIKWCPDRSKCLCAVAVGKDMFIVNPRVGEKDIIIETDLLFKRDETNDNSKGESTDHSVVDWQLIEESGASDEWRNGIRVIVKHRFEIKQIVWHYGGDYLAAVMPTGANKSVVIHHLSKRKSQVPFKKSKGIIQCVLFHPSRPYFFVATNRAIRVYNLVKQEMTKKLLPNCNEISSIAIHPQGDNVIVGSYDLRLSWFDLDLSTKPYKTLRYHKKAIRSVCYHERYPLFASASDDGTVIVSHGMVYNDLTQNPLIVPVKVLRGHTVNDGLGVTQCCFHPLQPWIFSAGADSTVRLFT